MIPGTESSLRIFIPARPSRAVAALVVAVVLFSALAASQLPASAQQFPTEISGRVVQGTAGSAVPAGLSVVLLIVDEQRQEIISNESTLVGTNGEFSFTDYVTGPGLTYRVAADNGEHTPSVDLTPGESSFSDVEITIYDSTASFDDIRISTYSLLVPDIDRVERLMGVLGVVSLINSGDRVWIPDLDNPALTGLDLLRFNLPEGFTDLSVESNLPAGNVLEIPTGFALTNPLPPGEFDILMTFVVGYSGDSLEFPLRLPYGAGQVRIMLPEGAGTVSGLGFGPSEGAIIDETAYSIVDGVDYPRDSQLDVKFSSLPTPSLVESTQSFLDGRGYIILIAWVAGAAMLGLLIYAFFFARQRKASSQAIPAGTYPEYEGLKRTAIVEAIARLDEQHAAAEIEDADYSARRAVLTQAALAARVTEVQPT
ncbi:MAG: hypothetical protein O3B04_00710 [Chloroflexi bacterium]|nr:hypothetical protein [Chloroflexota bacterium]